MNKLNAKLIKFKINNNCRSKINILKRKRKTENLRKIKQFWTEFWLWTQKLQKCYREEKMNSTVKVIKINL